MGRRSKKKKAHQEQPEQPQSQTERPPPQLEGEGGVMYAEDSGVVQQQFRQQVVGAFRMLPAAVQHQQQLQQGAFRTPPKKGNVGLVNPEHADAASALSLPFINPAHLVGEACTP
jgi:hypothetical protein